MWSNPGKGVVAIEKGAFWSPSTTIPNNLQVYINMCFRLRTQTSVCNYIHTHIKAILCGKDHFIYIYVGGAYIYIYMCVCVCVCVCECVCNIDIYASVS